MTEHDSRNTNFRVTLADKTSALAYYAKIAKKYESHVNGNALLRYFRRKERKSIEHFLHIDSHTKSLIDVGCGSGTWAKYAKERGLKVKAVDANEAMVKALQPLVDEVEVIDLDTWDPKQKFDRVVCAGVLDFVLDPEKAMKTLCQLVAPGGRLVLLVPDSGPFGLYYRMEKALIGVKVNLYSQKWLTEQAQKHGLSLVGRKRPLPSNVTYAFQAKA